MNFSPLITERLSLKHFKETDAEALFSILKDDVYRFAVCLKEDDIPIGEIHASQDESRDLGFVLKKEFWRRGIMTEAVNAVIERLMRDKVPYITATHDIHNPRSGAVMKKAGMRYCYSYEEDWQPKNIRVTFRMYQRNLDGKDERIYRGYWNKYPSHFVEREL